MIFFKNNLRRLLPYYVDMICVRNNGVSALNYDPLSENLLIYNTWQKDY